MLSPSTNPVIPLVFTIVCKNIGSTSEASLLFQANISASVTTR